MNQADNQLGHVIARRGLRREDEVARHRIIRRIVYQTIVENNNVKRKHQLTLVFVQPLDLNIEYRAGVKLHAKFTLDPIGKLPLVRILDLRKRIEEITVICKTLKLPQSIKLGNPFLADRLGNQLGEHRIGFQ